MGKKFVVEIEIYYTMKTKKLLVHLPTILYTTQPDKHGRDVVLVPCTK